MRGKVRPDKKEQAKAIIYLNPELSSKDIAKQIDVPDRTVRDWIADIKDDDGFAAYRQAKKLELIKKSLDIAASYSDHLAEPTVIAKASARDSAIVAGTMIDKAQLLAGEPTQITERQEPTPELVKELDQKVKRLKELTGT